MPEAVSIRRFLKGVDEFVWVELMHAEYRDYISWWRGTTAEEMLELEKSPTFNSEGRFIAEIDDRPVGLVHAHVEKSSGERKGFIRDFCVLPAFWGSEVEKQLLDAAITELRKRRVSRMRAWTGKERADRIRLLENCGFEFSHKTVDLRISLADVRDNIGENVVVGIRPARSEVERDIEKLNRLVNECFIDNPLHVPQTVEETKESLLSDSTLRWQGVLFAVLDSTEVGYIGLGIDERYNAEHDVKTGYISGLGVLPAHRRKGIGTRLLLHGFEVFQTKGMTSASIDTEDTNPTKALTLYEKVGFKVLQEYVTYTRSL